MISHHTPFYSDAYDITVDFSIFCNYLKYVSNKRFTFHTAFVYYKLSFSEQTVSIFYDQPFYVMVRVYSESSV